MAKQTIYSIEAPNSQGETVSLLEVGFADGDTPYILSANNDIAVKANPEGEPTGDLKKIQLGEEIYQLSPVEGNPEEEVMEELTKIKINETVYEVASKDEIVENAKENGGLGWIEEGDTIDYNWDGDIETAPQTILNMISMGKETSLHLYQFTDFPYMSFSEFKKIVSDATLTVSSNLTGDFEDWPIEIHKEDVDNYFMGFPAGEDGSTIISAILGDAPSMFLILTKAGEHNMVLAPGVMEFSFTAPYDGLYVSYALLDDEEMEESDEYVAYLKKIYKEDKIMHQIKSNFINYKDGVEEDLEDYEYGESSFISNSQEKSYFVRIGDYIDNLSNTLSNCTYKL